MNKINLSNLAHTWIIDLDGTIVEHNGHLNEGDKLLPGVREFFQGISQKDYIVILTARDKCYESVTIDFLNKNNIRFNRIVFGLPNGERIQINDIKPKGLKTAVAINITRDDGLHNLEIIGDRL